ncbi:Glyoxalase/Bleomycin resistance protein/Dihydroxybiphenyl dioxygenase [Aspergillus californicus]
MSPNNHPQGLHLTTLLINTYNPAITFFTETLNFTLIEDSPSTTNTGEPKRWVVVQPLYSPFPADSSSQAEDHAQEKSESGSTSGGSSGGGGASLLLAEASTAEQSALVGRQFGGRVGFFWRVDDFQRTYGRLVERGVEFVDGPRTEVYGTVAVFRDCVGNLWDLLGSAGFN